MSHSRQEFKRAALPLAKAALIVIAGAWVYGPVFRGAWLTDWDDFTEIAGNWDLRDAAGLWRIWFAPDTLDYLPLKTTVQWFQWHLWHQQVLGYHLTNVALHLCCALLLWRVLGMLGARLGWLGGLLFAVHPLAVESVAWISEFKNVLSLFFLLLAFDFWIRRDERKGGAAGPSDANGVNSSHGPDGVAGTRRPTSVGSKIDSGLRSLPRRSAAETGHPSASCPKSYLISLGFFLAAMLSKSSVVMFPFVLLLFAWWKRGRIGRSDVMAILPFLVVSLVLGLVAMRFQHGIIVRDHEPLHQGGLESRLAVAGLATVFYFSKCVWPFGLLPIYPRWAVDPPALWQFWPWAVIFGVILGLLAEVGRRVPAAPVGAESNWRRGDASPHLFFAANLIFGLGCFLIDLLPVLGFVPMSYFRLSWVADHLVYLPLVGIVALGAGGFGALFARAGFGSRTFLTLVASAGIAVLAIASHGYAAVFQSERGLWTYAEAGNPSAWLAHRNLGDLLYEEGRLGEAEPEIREALRLEPGNPGSHNSLGNLLVRTGRSGAAVAEYEAALRIDPLLHQIWFNLGDALFNLDRCEEAIVCYKNGLSKIPGHGPGHEHLGLALWRVGRVGEARLEFEEALRLDPGDTSARENLGKLR